MEDTKAVVSQALRHLASQPWYTLSEHCISALAILYCTNYLRKKGTFGDLLTGALKSIPGAEGAVERELEKEVDKAVKNMIPASPVPAVLSIPAKGWGADEVEAHLAALQKLDVDGKEGKLFAYVYSLQRPEIEAIVEKAFNRFRHGNALNPLAFPSLRQMEVEIVAMAAGMLHGPPGTVGSVTSGGTESILLAMKTYRERYFAAGGVGRPEVVLPVTAHPAFPKACHYFGLLPVFWDVGKDFRCDVRQLPALVSSRTCAVVVSAPQYPHGVVDPVAQVAAWTSPRGLPLHVDCCIGGFMLPWLARLGYAVPAFDFEVEGVTSISADIHKYGFGPKGASVVLYRTASLRAHQFYVHPSWPGGLFVSPGVTGTRGGGSIAAAWASLVAMGEEGYLSMAKQLMETSLLLQKEINQIPGLYVLGQPHMTIISFGSDDINILALADAMETKGWKMERQQNPPSVHMTLMPPHSNPEISSALISDLKWAVEWVRLHPESANEGSAGMYGMVAKVPAPHLIERFLRIFMSKMYSQN